MREYAYDMMRLGESLGGLDMLSEQEVWIVEEAAYWHARLLENRAADGFPGREPTLTVGEHQNGTSAYAPRLAEQTRIEARGTQRRFAAGVSREG